MGSEDATRWQESLATGLEEILSQVIEHLPMIIGAVLLLLIGWLIAKGSGILTRKAVIGLDSLFKRGAALDDTNEKGGRRSYALLASKLVFWSVMLFSIAVTGNILGWDIFSSWMNTLVIYLPNLITGLLIILAGFLFSNGIKGTVSRAIDSMGIPRSETLAGIVAAVILFTALVIGLKQIGINIDFLTNVLMVIVGVLLLGAALAFSLGAKTLVANIIGAQYVRKHCRVGEHMHMGEIEGSVVQVTQTSIVLETERGRTIIPAKYFQEQISSFSATVDGPENRDEPSDDEASR